MHFRISKNAQSFFSNIINLEGSHGSEDKNKFIHHRTEFTIIRKVIYEHTITKINEDGTFRTVV